MSKRSKKSNKNLAKSLLLPEIAVKSLNREGASKLKASNSENNLKKSKPLKPSLSTKSWSVNQKDAKIKPASNLNDNLTNFQELHINNESDEYDCSSNLLKARDSLENLLNTGRFWENTDLHIGTPSTSSSPDTSSPRSLPALNESTKTTVASKSLAWESSEKMTKTRRAKERKKKGSKVLEAVNVKSPKCDNNRDFKSGDDEKANTIPSSSNLLVDNSAYTAYEPKTSRSVVFTNEVMVVYFNGERVVSESKEPLKKELEQQVRNKEMRRGHLLYN